MDKEAPLFMTRQDLAKIGIVYSNTHLISLERIGAFPQRIRLSAQRVAWNHSEVMQWVDDRFARREAKQ